LNGFVYRLGEKEKEAIEKFRDLLTLMSSVTRKEEPGLN
jgi:hypothetical protein